MTTNNSPHTPDWLDLVARQVSWEIELAEHLERALTTYLRNFYDEHSEWLESICVLAHHQYGYQYVYITPKQKLVKEVLKSYLTPKHHELWANLLNTDGAQEDGLAIRYDIPEGFGTETTQPLFDALHRLDKTFKHGEFLLLMMDRKGRDDDFRDIGILVNAEKVELR